MGDYQERAIEEKNELSYKLGKLVDFMHSDEFARLDGINQGLLMVQQIAMTNYMDALSRRIEMF